MLAQEIFILIGAFLSLLLFLFHTRFYTLFRWEQEFDKISTVNKKIFYTINLATALFLMLFGIISIVYVKELARCEGLAFGICLAYALFWLWRLIWQIIYFKISKKLDKKWVIMNYSLRIIFAILFIAYFVPMLMSLMK